MSSSAIEVEDVSRTFERGARRVYALKGVSFSIPEGEIVALLGSNGAGKTTLAKILSTLLVPSSGTARIHGHDLVRDAAWCRRVTSVIFGGDHGFYGQLSGRDNLRFLATISGIRRRELVSRVESALCEVGLEDAAARPVETYSRGMRQRLHIAVGFLTAPKVLLLDEPTLGLDPIEAQRLRDAVIRLRDDGATVLLTSHYLLDIEKLADRVLLLQEGRIREDMTLASFVREAGYAAAVTVRGEGRLPAFAGLPRGVELASVEGDSKWAVTLTVREWEPAVFTLLGAVFDEVQVLDVGVREVRLDEAFARLMRTGNT